MTGSIRGYRPAHPRRALLPAAGLAGVAAGLASGSFACAMVAFAAALVGLGVACLALWPPRDWKLAIAEAGWGVVETVRAIF